MSTVNLLPEDYIKRRDQQRANVLCLILFGCVMVGVVGAAVASERKAAHARNEYEQVSSQYRQAGEMIAEMQQLESKKQQVLTKMQMASELLERVPRSYLLATLTKALPNGASLAEVKLVTALPQNNQAQPTDRNKFKTRAAARTAKTEEDEPKAKAVKPLVSVEVTGVAETDVQVAQFITNMRANPLMKSVELVYSEQVEAKSISVRKFQVLMDLHSEAQADVQVEGEAQTPSSQPAERTK